MKEKIPEKILMKRNCLYCAHEWEEMLTNEEIRKTIHEEAIGLCPSCGLPT